MISAFCRYQTRRLAIDRAAERSASVRIIVSSQKSAIFDTATLSGFTTASPSRTAQLQSVAICRTGPISSAAL